MTTPPAWMDEMDRDAPCAPPPNGAQDADRAKVAERVVQLVLARATLFHDAQGTAYAVVALDGRRGVLKLSSRPMKSWIARTARTEVGTTIASGAIDEAIGTLDGIARYDCEERPVHVRVAEHGSALYVDLGDETGACIEVTERGWSVIANAPVMFRRPDAMCALPRPQQGGTVDEFRPFFNAADDDALHLFVAWMVAALRPGRPFPILALHGEQGTAKSTASRVARALVDPNRAPVRSAPRTEDDLAVATVHSHVVAFDNLSGVQPWLSDALCRLATGGGLSKRTLYSDDDETIIEAKRPIIVNGIDDLANRADLAERCLVLALQAIPRSQRRDEATFWRAFEASAPRLLGVLLDGVAAALGRLHQVSLEELPRMADFARWIVAAESGLGLPPGTLLRAYARNRATVVDLALDASPVASGVRALLDRPAQGGRWQGEPAQLLAALNTQATEEVRRASGWPKSPRALSGALGRAATFLRDVGVEFDKGERLGHERRRIWTLLKLAGGAAPSAPSASTSAAESKGRRADTTADDLRTQTGRPGVRGRDEPRPSALPSAANRWDSRLGDLADGAEGADGAVT